MELVPGPGPRLLPPRTHQPAEAPPQLSFPLCKPLVDLGTSRLDAGDIRQARAIESRQLGIEVADLIGNCLVLQRRAMGGDGAGRDAQSSESPQECPAADSAARVRFQELFL